MGMDENTSPLYPRITRYTNEFCYHCHEWKAECPDCGVAVCVFCEEECGECTTSMW